MQNKEKNQQNKSLTFFIFRFRLEFCRKGFDFFEDSSSADFSDSSDDLISSYCTKAVKKSCKNGKLMNNSYIKVIS